MNYRHNMRKLVSRKFKKYFFPCRKFSNIGCDKLLREYINERKNKCTQKIRRK